MGILIRWVHIKLGRSKDCLCMDVILELDKELEFVVKIIVSSHSSYFL